MHSKGNLGVWGGCGLKQEVICKARMNRFLSNYVHIWMTYACGTGSVALLKFVSCVTESELLFKKLPIL